MHLEGRLSKRTTKKAQENEQNLLPSKGRQLPRFRSPHLKTQTVESLFEKIQKSQSQKRHW